MVYHMRASLDQKEHGLLHHSDSLMDQKDITIYGSDISLHILGGLLMPTPLAVEAFDSVVFSTGHFLIRAFLQQKAFYAGEDLGGWGSQRNKWIGSLSFSSSSLFALFFSFQLYFLFLNLFFLSILILLLLLFLSIFDMYRLHISSRY